MNSDGYPESAPQQPDAAPHISVHLFIASQRTDVQIKLDCNAPEVRNREENSRQADAVLNTDHDKFDMHTSETPGIGCAFSNIAHAIAAFVFADRSGGFSGHCTWSAAQQGADAGCSV